MRTIGVSPKCLDVFNTTFLGGPSAKSYNLHNKPKSLQSSSFDRKHGFKNASQSSAKNVTPSHISVPSQRIHNKEPWKITKTIPTGNVSDEDLTDPRRDPRLRRKAMQKSIRFFDRKLWNVASSRNLRIMPETSKSRTLPEMSKSRVMPETPKTIPLNYVSGAYVTDPRLRKSIVGEITKPRNFFLDTSLWKRDPIQSRSYVYIYIHDSSIDSLNSSGDSGFDSETSFPSPDTSMEWMTKPPPIRFPMVKTDRRRKLPSDDMKYRDGRNSRSPPRKRHSLMTRKYFIDRGC